METATDKITLSFPSNPRYLKLVRGVMKQVADIMGCTSDETRNIILAVDEACANVIQHSYMGDKTGKIDLFLEIRVHKLVITLQDYGRPCDVTKIKPRSLDDIRPGGLGTHIMNKVMDGLDFDCSSPEHNRLRMEKNIAITP